MDRHGFSPEQRVFGRSLRLPASIILDDVLDKALMVMAASDPIKRNASMVEEPRHWSGWSSATWQRPESRRETTEARPMSLRLPRHCDLPWMDRPGRSTGSEPFIDLLAGVHERKTPSSMPRTSSPCDFGGGTRCGVGGGIAKRNARTAGIRHSDGLPGHHEGGLPTGRKHGSQRRRPGAPAESHWRRRVPEATGAPRALTPSETKVWTWRARTCNTAEEPADRRYHGNSPRG